MSGREKKNYKCDFCAKRFKKEYDFLKHKRILHQNQSKNDLTCTICSEVFTSSMSLKKHKWNEHESQKENKCDICGKAFLKISELNLHIDVIHREKYKCHICDKNLAKFGLKQHMKRVHDS